MEELVKELVNVIEFPKKGEEQEFNCEQNGVSVEFKANENEITLVLKRTRPLFYDWLDALDDDLFQSACVRFTEESNVNLKDFDKMIKEGEADEEIELFKDIVADIVSERIEHLKQYVR